MATNNASETIDSIVVISGWCLSPCMITLNIFCIFILRKCMIRQQLKYILYNLAVTDVIAGLMVFVTSTTRRDLKLLRLAGCFFLYGVTRFALFASMFITTLLAADRWMVLEYPLRCDVLVSPKRIKMAISTCWLASTILTLASVIEVILQFQECRGDFGGGIVYTAIANVAFFPSLFLICLACGRTLFIARKQIMSISVFESLSQETVSRMNRRATFTVLLVLLAFVVCYTPHYIGLLMDLSPKEERSYLATLLGPHTSIILVELNSVLNPIIYIYTNKEIKAGVRRVICKCDTHSKQMQA